jgi:hypothetical protein
MNGDGSFAEIDGREFGRMLVAELAPEESSFFDEIVAAKPKERRDVPLGFGVADGTAFILTTALVEVGKVVFGFLWANGRDSAGKLVKDCSEAARVSLTRSFKEWVRHPVADHAPLTLDKGQFDQLAAQVDAGPAANIPAPVRARLRSSLGSKIVRQ